MASAADSAAGRRRVRDPAQPLQQSPDAVQFHHLHDARPGHQRDLRVHWLSAVRLCRLFRRRRLRLLADGDPLARAAAHRALRRRRRRHRAGAAADAAVPPVGGLFLDRQSRRRARRAAGGVEPESGRDHQGPLRHQSQRDLRSSAELRHRARGPRGDARARDLSAQFAFRHGAPFARIRSAPAWPASMSCASASSPGS